MAQQKLGTLKQNFNNGFLLYSGNEICEIVEPPLPAKRNAYYCDSKFHTDEIQNLFKTHEEIGYVIVTSKVILIVISQGTRTKIIFRKSVNLPTNTRRGGQSANRFSRLRQEKRHVLKTKILEEIQNLQTPKVILSGNGILLEEFEKLFKFTGTIKISGNENIIQETLAKSQGVLHAEEISRERKLKRKFEKILEMESERLVFGLENIEKYYSEGFLQCIILTNNAEKYSNIQIYHVKHLDFLDTYDGVVGILYKYN